MWGNTQYYLLLISGLCSFTPGSSEFHLIDMFKNYEDAKSYCREMYTDLATIHDFIDMRTLINLVSNDSKRAWIGLELADKHMWQWSLPGHKLDYINWKEGNPRENDQDLCAAMDENGKWFESDCKTKRSFVCHGDKGSHIFVADTKLWRDAQSHCRDLSTDLVSIQSAEENEAVRNMSQNVWIGLFSDPWKWSDGTNSSYRYWSPFQPNYLEGQDCVAVVFKNSGKWNDLKCSSKRKFICQGANQVPTTAGTSTHGSTKVTNLSSLSNITFESIIVTVHFTVVTNQTNSTTTFTSASPLSNNASLQPMTTPTTTEGTSALPNTTQSVTLAPNTPGNFVLIQQNLTWVEATAYCRQNFIDLVHISTEDIQVMVAERAKNATTMHVWIGLKYACSLKVWFWTRSTSGCYQNWAPGQGTEGNYSCGFTGAIEATGRQQWVGLPETEKLNFICHACTG